MIISRTPYRISFLGGGTDFPGWFKEHGGSVLAASIDKYCYLTCRYLPPFFEHRLRIVYSQIECCQSIDEISHPVVREILRTLQIHRGLEIHHDGDLPARSGMGSSSSFVVGLLHALHALSGRIMSKQHLAEESIRLEQEVLQETVGCQDQLMASYGGLNHIAFNQSGDIWVQPLTLSAHRKQHLNDHLMLFYTGIQRTSSKVASSYALDFRRNYPLLKTMSRLVRDGLALLSSSTDIVEFGALLHEAWVTKCRLSDSVSNSVVDRMYEEALSAGALGGKLLGAGGGGFLLLFVRPEQQAQVKERLDSFVHVPFAFETSGSQIIFCEQERDYGMEDARRVRRAEATACELSQVA